jgi:hypothetical protein
MKRDLRPGLPDGLFSNQKSQFWSSLEGLTMENIGIFNDHLVYFTAIGNILWPFDIFCAHLVYFPGFGTYFVPRKIWQPCLRRANGNESKSNGTQTACTHIHTFLYIFLHTNTRTHKKINTYIHKYVGTDIKNTNVNTTYLHS